MNVKNIFFGACVSAFLISNTATAQEGEGIIKDLSIEAGYGFNTPFSPKENITTGDYSGFNSFHVGLRYAFNKEWGLRGTFGFAKFENKDISDLGVKQSRLMLEALYNVSYAVSGVENQPFEVLAHAGLGLSQAKSHSNSGKDMMGSFQIGVLPTYNISSQVSVFLDVVYHLNFSQNYGYNGLSIDQTSGSFLTTNLGVAVKLGK